MLEFIDALQCAHGYLSTCDQRARVIYSRRLVATDPQTLDELGLVFGVTRERVRQLESQLVKGLRDAGVDRIAAAAKFPSNSRWIVHWSQLGDEDTRKFFAPTVGGALELLKACGLIELGGQEWVSWGVRCVSRDTRRPFIESMVDQISAGNMDLAAVQEYLSQYGLDADFAENWLSDHGMRLELGKYRAGRLVASAFLNDLFEQHRRPLELEELDKFIGEKWSPATIRNVLQSSEEFVRVDVAKYALAKWGLPAYEGISAEIEKLILSQGPLPLAEVIRELAERFDVEMSSIEAYCRKGALEVRDGLVRIRNVPRVAYLPPRLSDIPPSSWTDITRTNQGFEQRLPVTADRLRGSGSPSKQAVMAILGIARGRKKSIPIAGFNGGIDFSWENSQPYMGSLRSVLTDLGADIGDELIIQYLGQEGLVAEINMTLRKPGR